MIIRIQSNYGLWKLNINNNTNNNNDLKIHELIEIIQNNYKINKIKIKLKNDKNIILEDDKEYTIKDYNINNGDILYIIQKLKKIERDKSYIEEGILIPSGISYIGDEENEDHEDNNNNNNNTPTTTSTTVSNNNNKEKEVKEEVNNINSVVKDSKISSNENVSDSENLPQNNSNIPLNDTELINSLKDYDFDDEFQEPDLRPPDQSKTMRLLGGDDEDDDNDHDHPFHPGYFIHNNINDINSILMRSNDYHNYQTFHNHQNRNRQNYQSHLGTQSESTKPTIDPEVIKQMREIGLSESQIQEQIDYFIQKTEQTIPNRRKINNEPPFRIQKDIKFDLGDPPYGVGIGSSVRTRADRIGLTNQHPTYPHNMVDLSNDDININNYQDDIHSQLDKRIAEIEEKDLMEALNQSKKLTENIPKNEENNLSTLSHSPITTPLDISQNNNRSNNNLNNLNTNINSDELRNLLEDDYNGDDDFDLELALKLSMEDMKLNEVKKQLAELPINNSNVNLSSSNEVRNNNKKSSLKKESPKSQNNSQNRKNSSSKYQESNKFQDDNYHKSNNNRNPYNNNRGNNSNNNNSNLSSSPISTNILNISALSQGPRLNHKVPTRSAPVPPLNSQSQSTSQSTSQMQAETKITPRSRNSTSYSSSSQKSYSTPTQASNARVSPRQNSKNNTPRNSFVDNSTNNLTSDNHRVAAPRKSLDRNMNSKLTPRDRNILSQSVDLSDSPDKYELEMLDHAIAMSLANSIETEDTTNIPTETRISRNLIQNEIIGNNNNSNNHNNNYRNNQITRTGSQIISPSESLISPFESLISPTSDQIPRRRINPSNINNILTNNFHNEIYDNSRVQARNQNIEYVDDDDGMAAAIAASLRDTEMNEK